MPFEDLQAIIPEQFKEVANRKIYLVFGGIIILLVVCCLALSILVLVQHGKGPGSQDSRQAAALTLQKHFCLTPDCLRTSANVIGYMDYKTPPCDNFHKYSCDNWARSKGIPPDHPSMSMWRDLYDRNEERLREVIDSPIRHDTPDSAERKLKDFFRACTHDYGRMRDAGKEMIKIVKDKLGGWQTLDPDGFAQAPWDFNKALKEMTSELLVPALFKVRVVYDWQGSRGSRYLKNMPGVTFGGLGLGSYYYHREDKVGVRDAYQDMMRQMAVLLIRDANVTLDPSVMEERVEQFVKDAYGVEYAIATVWKQARKLPGYWRSARIRIGELNKNMTQVKWRQLMEGYFEHADISSRTLVRMTYFKYFGLMEEWLKNITQNEAEFKRMMNNYMVWRFVDDYAPNLSWEYKQTGYRFYEAVSGTTDFPPTWESCLNLARRKLGTIVSGEYMRKHVSKKSIQNIEEIGTHVKEALMNTIEDIPWMDNITQARAKDKLDSVEVHVAYNPEHLTDEFLDDLHAKVDVSRDYSFFRNLMNINAYEKVLHAKTLESGEAFFMWRTYAAGIASIYPSLYWRSNQLLIPMGSIQPPIYDAKAPKFFNFGSIGGYIGELMTKSIGEMGRYVMNNGTFRNWWTQETYKSYKEERKCMVSHFNNMSLSFLVNGENKTVNINGRYHAWQAIDDMAGIKAAYKAYKTWESGNGPETLPAGMNMTVDQAFFIAVTQLRCYVRRPEAAYQWARSWRIPEDVVINSALQHTQIFQDTFQCKPEDNMGRHDTCEMY